MVRIHARALARSFTLSRCVATSTGIALILFSSSRCAPPEPIALIPIPPGVDYPWRTETDQPDPYETAAFRRARLVVVNAHAGADHYAERWEQLPQALTMSGTLPVGEAEQSTRHQSEHRPRRSRSASAPDSVGSGESGDSASASLRVSTRADAELQADARTPSSEPAAGSLIDINTATSRELESLSGIGPSLAARIIDGRPYRRVRDLLGVRGIGPRTLERLETLITVR